MDFITSERREGLGVWTNLMLMKIHNVIYLCLQSLQDKEHK